MHNRAIIELKLVYDLTKQETEGRNLLGLLCEFLSECVCVYHLDSLLWLLRVFGDFSGKKNPSSRANAMSRFIRATKPRLSLLLGVWSSSPLYFFLSDLFYHCSRSACSIRELEIRGNALRVTKLRNDIHRREIQVLFPVEGYDCYCCHRPDLEE